MTLELIDTDNELVKMVKSQAQVQENIRIPQISVDSSGLINTRADSFVPPVDVLSDDDYKIFMDVPGISFEDIQLYR